MTQQLADSVCIRWGKPRVFSRRWKDNGDDGRGSVVIHVESVCPDADCQKIVDAKFNEMRERRSLSQNRRKDIVLSPRAKKQL